MTKFHESFTDAWGNKVSLISGVTDSVLHLVAKDNNEPTEAYLNGDDVEKLIELLQKYKAERLN